MQDIRAKIVEVKDFPKPGIGFKDITPVVLDAAAFRKSVDALAAWAASRRPEVVVGLESRGYLFAAPLAYNLGLGLALIRKKGKLPRRTVAVQAPNEYAVEVFEMHTDAVRPGQRAVIIDDLIATGSSSVSSIDLVHSLGGRVAGFGALVELTFLKGGEAIRKAHPEVDVFSLIRMDS
ncbi:MAG: adenine phosphoribosyltransferase [Candidatus Aminicenantes bacterium]|nr:adenine phosphoribosyltransferase [Candidatus Aminicenantes bacterium]